MALAPPTYSTVPGEIVDHRQSRSYVNGETAAAIPYGIMVAHGAVGAVLIRSSVDLLLGVATFPDEFQASTDAIDAGIPATRMARVLTRGEVLVLLEESVSIGDPVVVRATGSGTLGLFRGSLEEPGTIDISRMARWLSSGLAGGVALLEIDMTNERAATNGGYAAILDNNGAVVTNNSGEILYALEQ